MGESHPHRKLSVAGGHETEQGRDTAAPPEREPTGGQPAETVEEILAAADARDAAADARDNAAVERENALDKKEFLSQEASYGDHWAERRAASMDRARSKEDRVASQEDRVALTEMVEEAGGEERPEAGPGS